MDTFIDAHYFTLPTQGNIYSTVNLSLSNGINKCLIASLKRKVFLFEFHFETEGVLKPIVKEIPFTYIPSGAEIISIDAFNRCDKYDDFFIGITITKTNPDQGAENYLHIYTEQIEEGAGLNLDSIAQNCLMLELTFIPYHLYHTDVYLSDGIKEIVWLVSGSDTRLHMFREDPLNHAYSETELDDLFPEFLSLPSIVLWMDIKYTDDKKVRMSAYGCENGVTCLFLIDVKKGIILNKFSEEFDSSISRVLLFKLKDHFEVPNEHLPIGASYFDGEISEVEYHMVACSTLHTSVVFMDVVKNGFNKRKVLNESDKHDATLCACAADINFDGSKELLLGSYAHVLQVYKFQDDEWILVSQNKFVHPIHSIHYLDITGDGVNELIVLTMAGAHILQHNPYEMYNIFCEKYNCLLPCEPSEPGSGNECNESEDETNQPECSESDNQEDYLEPETDETLAD